MGLMDNMKDKAKELAEKHGDKIEQGLDKAGEMAKNKLGPEHGEKIDKKVQQGKDAVQDFGEGQPR